MTREAAIGIDVGGTGTKGGIVDLSGAILHRVAQRTDPTAGTKGILRVAEQLLAHAAASDFRIVAIGVGAAGFVDAATGSMTFSPNITYDDPQVGAALEARFDVPVVVDNDANAATWGERTFGSARGSDHVAMLTVGTGVGGGFVVGGRLVRGYTGAGAEFGHTVVEIDGPPCPCGLRGCLEQLCSGKAIARLGREAAAEDPSTSMIAFAGSLEAITAKDVTKAAREYDDTARRVLRRAGRALGIGLSNVVNVFDPEVLVLGGHVIAAGEPYLGPARDQLFAMTTAQRRRPARLDVTTLGDDAGIVGAAALGAGWS